MPILAFAARHHQVGLENLERLSARPDAVRRAVVLLCPGVIGAVVLATCNRFELYLDVMEPADDVVLGVLQTVARELEVPFEATETTLARVPDPGAHLCAVAAGLDSMVLGEREIAGQVRRAIAHARSGGSSSGGLERLFAAASRAARRVANETSLGSRGRSVVDAALDAAGVRVGARCVLVGTGSYAGATVAALARRGAASIDVFSSTGRAAGFARPRGLGTVEADALPEAIAAADLVVACSGGPDLVLGLDHFAQRRLDMGPVAVVDLALRRDVDPAVGALSSVRLLSLRELAGLGPGAGDDDVARARAITAEVAGDLSSAVRAVAWSRDLVVARRRALAAHPPHARRLVHARLHHASVLAHAAAQAGDRRRFDAAIVEVRAVAELAPLA